MRTDADLDAAFAQLVHDADVHFPMTREPAPSGRRHTQTRRWLPIAAGAAAVLAVVIALSATAWTGSSDTNPEPTGGVTVIDPRSMPFRIDPASGLHVRNFSGSTYVAAGHANQEIWLVGAQGRFRVDLMNPGASIGDWVKKLDGVTPGDPVPGLAVVDINGAVGYFGPFDDTADPTLGPLDIPPPRLVWEYAPGNWASIDSHRSSSIEADLIAAAQALDFARTTAVRIPMRLSAPPLGLQVDYVNTSMQGGWDAIVSYGPEQGTRIVIEVTNRTGAPGGEPTTVDGRPAVWDAGQRTLEIDAGDGVTIAVSGVADDGNPGDGVTIAASGAAGNGDPVPTREQLTAIARTVSLPADPNDQASWFDAGTSIP